MRDVIHVFFQDIYTHFSFLFFLRFHRHLATLHQAENRHHIRTYLP